MLRAILFIYIGAFFSIQAFAQTLKDEALQKGSFQRLCTQVLEQGPKNISPALLKFLLTEAWQNPSKHWIQLELHESGRKFLKNPSIESLLRQAEINRQGSLFEEDLEPLLESSQIEFLFKEKGRKQPKSSIRVVNGVVRLLSVQAIEPFLRLLVQYGVIRARLYVESYIAFSQSKHPSRIDQSQGRAGIFSSPVASQSLVESLEKRGLEEKLEIFFGVKEKDSLSIFLAQCDRLGLSCTESINSNLNSGLESVFKIAIVNDQTERKLYLLLTFLDLLRAKISVSVSGF